MKNNLINNWYREIYLVAAVTLDKLKIALIPNLLE